MNAAEMAIGAIFVAALCAAGYIVRCLVMGTQSAKDTERLDWLETESGRAFVCSGYELVTRRTIDAARRNKTSS